MRIMIAILAAVCASAVPAPAMAWDSGHTAALLGGILLGGAVRHQQILQQPPYGGYGRQQQIIVVERQPQVIVVRETAPTTVVVADPKTIGTACRSNTYGWIGVWTTLSDGSKACKAF